MTITVWDYYGEATPIKPAIDGFQKEYPWITVKYEALDWDSMNEKFAVGVAAGAAPDVATLDMTWIPTLASNGVLEDLSTLSGGLLNGAPIADQYSAGANEAMQYDGTYVTMLFDFDAYALYYRSDLFEEKGIAVPTTWDEMRAAAKKLAEDGNGDGKLDRYLYQVWPDTFHYAQFLFQNGGTHPDRGPDAPPPSTAPRASKPSSSTRPSSTTAAGSTGGPTRATRWLASRTARSRCSTTGRT